MIISTTSCMEQPKIRSVNPQNLPNVDFLVGWSLKSIIVLSEKRIGAEAVFVGLKNLAKILLPPMSTIK